MSIWSERCCADGGIESGAPSHVGGTSHAGFSSARCSKSAVWRPALARDSVSACDLFGLLPAEKPEHLGRFQGSLPPASLPIKPDGGDSKKPRTAPRLWF